MKKSLAVIIPVYRSTKTVAALISSIEETWNGVCPYHIYLIDDGNTPEVRAFLVKYCLKDNVSLLCLKENCGQQNAVLCGLRQCNGYDYVAVMDDDLAHPVQTLYEMYEKMQEGYDLIYGIPEGKGYSFGSRMRDVLFRFALSCPRGKKVSSFRIMTGEVAEYAAKWNKKFFYFSATVLKKYRKIENVTYKREEETRDSGYTTGKRMKLFRNIVWYYCLPFGAKAKKPLYVVSDGYPKLMVLGGSNCQLHAIERAKKEGMYTILADYTENPPGARIADVHEKASTFDYEACLAVAKKYAVQGIMTMGTDQPVLTVARVSRALRLPCPLTEQEALLVTNKKYMKGCLSRAGIPTSPWMLIDKYTTVKEILQLNPPYVLKPLDSQGQRGVFKLNTPEEVLAHLGETLSFSRCNEALLEEFYESEEMTVSGYVDDGKLIILSVTDRLLYPDPVHIGVCIGHRFPTAHMRQYKKIRELSDHLVEAFHIKNGPFYLQLLTGKQGIRVNELACRIGGAFEDVMIPWLTGFDLLGAVMNNAFGHRVDVTAFRDFKCNKLDKAVSVQLLFCHSGKIASMTPPEELKRLPFVLDCGYNYGVGDIIPEMENATARFGHAVITGSKTTMAHHLHKFYEALSVISEDGRELKHRLYPEK